MKPLPRDGTFNDNGLTAEFRFVRAHAEHPDMSFVDTAWGELCIHDSLLAWDPPLEQPDPAKGRVPDQHKPLP